MLKKIVKKTLLPLVVAVVLFVFLTSFAIPSLFRSGITDSVYNIELEKYDQAVESLNRSNDALKQQYEKDMAAYRTEVEIYNELKAAYDLEFQAYQVNYDMELAAYEELYQQYVLDVQQHEKECERITQEANENALKNGTPFLVNISYYRTDNVNIGYEWFAEYKIDGENVRQRDDVVTLREGSTTIFFACYTEYDEVPDVGSNYRAHTITRQDTEEGFAVEFNVNVSENRGKNAGKTAKFTVTFEMIPQDVTVEVDSIEYPEAPQEPEKPQYAPPKRKIISKPNAPKEPSYLSLDVALPSKEQISSRISTASDIYAYSQPARRIRLAAIFALITFFVFIFFLFGKEIKEKNPDVYNKFKIKSSKVILPPNEIFNEDVRYIECSAATIAREERVINAEFRKCIAFLAQKHQLQDQLKKNEKKQKHLRKINDSFFLNKFRHVNTEIEEKEKEAETIRRQLMQTEVFSPLKNYYTQEKNVACFREAFASLPRTIDVEEIAVFFPDSVRFLQGTPNKIYVFSEYAMFAYYVKEQKIVIHRYTDKCMTGIRDIFAQDGVYRTRNLLKARRGIRKYKKTLSSVFYIKEDVGN